MYKFDKTFISTHTLAECLDEYDCNYATLLMFCRLKRVRYLKNTKAKYLKFQEQLANLAGKECDASVAEKIGCSRADVFNYRMEHNIEPGRYHRHTIPGSIDQILKEYNELKTLQKVADKHNVTRERVRQWFKAAGYHYEKNIGYVKDE